MNSRKKILILFSLLLAGVLQAKVTAVATTTMAADLVRSIGGEHVEVVQMMGPGVDPHLYKATRDDVLALRQADIIFYNGLHLEGRLTDVLVKMARRKPVYALAEGIDEAKLLHPAEMEGAEDPHIWFDPRLWADAVAVVVEGLSEADVANAAAYQERGAALKAAYLALHQWGLERVAQVPAERRILITSHDAYNYFGRAFGFQVVGVQGISTVTEAGLADVAQIIEFIREKQIPAIFVESSVSPRAIQRISAESGAEVGGELFSDAMGEPGDMHTLGGETYDVGTYRGMFMHNVLTITEALQ